MAFSVIGRGPERARLEAEAERTRPPERRVHRPCEPLAPARGLSRRRHPVRPGAEHPDAQPDRDALEARGVHGVGKAGHLCRQRPGGPEIERIGSGLAVPPEEPGAIATAIQALVGDPPRAAALGEAGRAYARARRDERVLATALLAAIEELELVTEPAPVLHVCDFAAPYGGSFIRQLELLDAELRRRGRGPSAYGFPENVREPAGANGFAPVARRFTCFRARLRVQPPGELGRERGRSPRRIAGSCTRTSGPTTSRS